MPLYIWNEFKDQVHVLLNTFLINSQDFLDYKTLYICATLDFNYCSTYAWRKSFH